VSQGRRRPSGSSGVAILGDGLDVPETSTPYELMAGSASLHALALIRSSSRRSGGADCIAAQPARRLTRPGRIGRECPLLPAQHLPYQPQPYQPSPYTQRHCGVAVT
jgi:hypothetical protein